MTDETLRWSGEQYSGTEGDDTGRCFIFRGIKLVAVLEPEQAQTFLVKQKCDF